MLEIHQSLLLLPQELLKPASWALKVLGQKQA